MSHDQQLPLNCPDCGKRLEERLLNERVFYRCDAHGLLWIDDQGELRPVKDPRRGADAVPDNTYRWDGEHARKDRRVNLRLRELIDTITTQLSVQAVQIAGLRAEVDDLKKRER
jgi:hypothetical protein